MGQDTELTALTLSQARDGLRAKEFSARELTQSFVDRVAASEKLNAYILQTPERALEAADQSDARLGTDDARPLEGLPIGVKDLFCTNGVRTTACSKPPSAARSTSMVVNCDRRSEKLRSDSG